MKNKKKFKYSNDWQRLKMRNTLHNNMDDDDRVVEIWDRGDRKEILCDASVAALLGVTHADAAAMEPDPKKWLNLAPSNPLADDYRYVVAQSMR